MKERNCVAKIKISFLKMPIDSNCLFCIVGRNDNLIYLSDLSGAKVKFKIWRCFEKIMFIEI